MFLALRDIIAARGRFGIIAAVVGLITLLVVMLSGLTGGLGQQNTSALEALDPDRVALTDETYTSSRVDADDLAAWRDVEGVTQATPVGTSQTSLTTDDGVDSVAVIGLPAGYALPGGEEIPAHGAIVSEDLGVVEGDEVRAGGEPLTVASVTGDEYYSHSLVMWVSTETWQAVTRAAPGELGNAVFLTGSADWDAAPLESMSLTSSFSALPAYSSEQGSLLMIQGFLYVISALVIVSFLTVWTIQRTRDLAILRAIGASPRYLLRDALGQAALVLIAGAGLGALVGLGLGWAASGVVPFRLDAQTVLVPAVGVFVLGLLGAVFSTRSVTKINPLTALNAA